MDEGQYRALVTVVGCVIIAAILIAFAILAR